MTFSVAPVLAIAMLLFGLPHADTGNGSGILKSTVKGGGVQTHASEQTVAGLGQGRDLNGAIATSPMEYRVELACPVAGTAAVDSACQRAVAACQVNGQQIGSGFLYNILARVANSSDPWKLVGSTCFGQQVPGAGPTVTMAMIRDAMHSTPWATASVSTQPAGNITLVGLKTFYQVTWSASGYEPGEIESIDPSRMLGMRVDIRPRVDHFTYVFGDGTQFGPTKSTGGVYPTGDIVHTYTASGSYPARVDTTLTADFRINGGPWTAIPETVTVTGATTTVQVKTARAVLVRN